MTEHAASLLQSKQAGKKSGKVFVIGGAGFVGLHALRHMAAQGYEVHATHRPGRTPAPCAGVTWIPYDLNDAGSTTAWPADCDSVVYLAQARSWRDFPGGAAEVMRVNVDAVLQAAQFAVKHKAQRLIVASTGSIYSQTRQPAVEDEAIDGAATRNFYAASKLAAEILLRPFAALLPVIVLRPFFPYGPDQGADMLLPRLVHSVAAGKPIVLSGQDGLQMNPVAVADVARVLEACLGLNASTTLNVAGPEVVTLRQLGQTIGRLLQREPIFEVRGQETPAVVVGDTGQLRQTLGWAPATGLQAGLQTFVAPRQERQSA